MTLNAFPPIRQPHSRQRSLRTRRFEIEALEARKLLATLTVNTTSDDTTPDGTLSLREAIEVSNGTLPLASLSPSEQSQISGALSTPNTIAFDIGAGGLATIYPLSPLPDLTSSVIIDGTTQPGYSSTPLIEIDGFAAGSSTDGLRIAAANCTVKGLVINDFSDVGLVILGSGGSRIVGNFIGTDPTGLARKPNAYSGVYLYATNNNSIGGTTPSERNLISGNNGNGITILEGSDSNQVSGNYIGTDLNGNYGIANAFDGIYLTNTSNNTIGGEAPGSGNTISGNKLIGVEIYGAASGNLIAGNLVGTDATGSYRIANSSSGVVISYATGNRVGGTTESSRNIISGNSGDGIELYGPGTENNVVQGNYIGTDVTGTQALGNLLDGIAIESASNNLIGGDVQGAGNLISANRYGIELELASGSNIGPSGNRIAGNRIGTDATGNTQIGNFSSGIGLFSSTGNTIGGTTSLSRNLISGNAGNGIKIASNSNGNLIQGNYIGTDDAGTSYLPNDSDGIEITGSKQNTVGGTIPGSRNVISGNLGGGIFLNNNPDGNLIQGNYIGTTESGLDGLVNNGNGIKILFCTNEIIGGTTPGAGNVISFNIENGIYAISSIHVVVRGNLIGTDKTGNEGLANGGSGVSIRFSTQTVVGGGQVNSGNVISSNVKSGIEVLDLSTRTVIQGNKIGTDIDGAYSLGNSLYGIDVRESSGTLIGGPTANPGFSRSLEGNVISGNGLSGISIIGATSTANVIWGNAIGIDGYGSDPLGNGQSGVIISDKANGNLIGGASIWKGNVISGNGSDGISFTGVNTSGNVVQSNYIGTAADGSTAVPNRLRGVFIQDGSFNSIGGATPNTFNVISGNGQDGVHIENASAIGNRVVGNYIGTDVDGVTAVPNGANGISIIAAPSTIIGGSTSDAINVISGNAGNGIFISNLIGAGGRGTQIFGNLIGTDGSSKLPIGNQEDGILIENSQNITVGGLPSSDSNTISSNSVAGIEIRGRNSRYNWVCNNFIGRIEIDDSPALGNLIGVLINGASQNLIGGVLPNAANLISGNANPAGSGVGIEILGAGATGNLVQTNQIGTNLDGTSAIPNNTGVLINNVGGNTIGGSGFNEGNLISGNRQSNGSGVNVFITGPGAIFNRVQGNFIGTDISGEAVLPGTPLGIGVLISDTGGNNIIGGTTVHASNIIAGLQVGIYIFATQSAFNQTPGSVVQGNFIGSDSSGTLPLGNVVGIYINGVPLNTIGGTSAASRNYLLNNQVGIYLLGGTATRNTIQGNSIGLEPDGVTPLGNHIGIFVDQGSNNAIVGNFIAGNLVSKGEGSTGIYLFNNSSSNNINNNFIGTDASGRSNRSLAQGDYGVLLYNASNNPIAKSTGSNRIVGSGIANVREYTSPSALQATVSSRQLSHPSGPLARRRRRV